MGAERGSDGAVRPDTIGISLRQIMELPRDVQYAALCGHIRAILDFTSEDPEERIRMCGNLYDRFQEMRRQNEKV